MHPIPTLIPRRASTSYVMLAINVWAVMINIKSSRFSYSKFFYLLYYTTIYNYTQEFSYFTIPSLIEQSLLLWNCDTWESRLVHELVKNNSQQVPITCRIPSCALQFSTFIGKVVQRVLIVLNQARHTKEKAPNIDELNGGLMIYQKYPKLYSYHTIWSTCSLRTRYWLPDHLQVHRYFPNRNTPPPFLRNKLLLTVLTTIEAIIPKPHANACWKKRKYRVYKKRRPIEIHLLL